MQLHPLPLLFGFMAVSSVTEAATAYAVDLRNDRFLNFDVKIPSSQNVLATGYTGNYFGLDFNQTGTTLYGLLYTDLGAARLDSLSLTDGSILGSVTVAGLDSDAVVTGLTVGPENLAHLTTYGVSASKLYTVDLITGETALVGVMTSSGFIVDIAASPAGELVVHNATSDSFHSVNPDTGALTLIGSHGIDANFAQGMDFDPISGFLFAAVYSGEGVNTYGTVSIFDGTIDQIAGLLSGEYEIAIGVIPEPGTASLLIATAGMIFRRRRPGT